MVKHKHQQKFYLSRLSSQFSVCMPLILPPPPPLWIYGIEQAICPALPSCGTLAPVRHKQSQYKKPDRAPTLTPLQLFLESLGCVVKDYQSNQKKTWYHKQPKKIFVYHPHAVFFSLLQACTTNPSKNLHSMLKLKQAYAARFISCS